MTVGPAAVSHPADPLPAMSAWDVITSVVGVVSAVATAGAVIVAFVFGLGERKARTAADARAIRAEERPDRIEQAAAAERVQAAHERAETLAGEREERLRGQALQVIAWFEEQPVPGQSWTGMGGNRHVPTQWVCRLVNASPHVVFDVSLDSYDRGAYLREIATARVLPPGADRTFVMRKDLPETMTAVLRFRDLRGIWWKRHQNGHLVRTHPNGIDLVEPAGE